MASSIALKDGTVARGNPDFASGSNYKPGRTVAMYVNGKFAGVQPTGPFGTVAYGAVAGDVFMPGSGADGVPAGAAKPVCAQDNTDGTNATTTVTLT